MSKYSPLAGSDYPFPAKPVVLSENQKLDYKAKIKTLLKEKDAV